MPSGLASECPLSCYMAPFSLGRDVSSPYSLEYPYGNPNPHQWDWKEEKMPVASRKLCLWIFESVLCLWETPVHPHSLWEKHVSLPRADSCPECSVRPTTGNICANVPSEVGRVPCGWWLQNRTICPKMCAALFLRSSGLWLPAPQHMSEPMHYGHVPPCTLSWAHLSHDSHSAWVVGLRTVAWYCGEPGARHRDFCHPFEP